MKDETKELLVEAAIEVFGTMYFMPVAVTHEGAGPEDLGGDSSWLWATIHFSGLYNAAVNFYFPMELASEIVEGFLGIEASEVTEQQMKDTIQEAANMVVGCFLGKVDPQGESKLDIPKSEFITEANKVDLSSKTVIGFSSDTGKFWVYYDEED